MQIIDRKNQQAFLARRHQLNRKAEQEQQLRDQDRRFLLRDEEQLGSWSVGFGFWVCGLAVSLVSEHKR